jgi:predicted GNAT superfamily acetyltransferase
MADLQVRELRDPAEHAAAAALFGTVWYGDSGVPIEAQLLTAVAHSGGYVAGAYAGTRLLGASFGFLGRHRGTLVLHSHLTGVLPGQEHHGLGFAIKRHQRQWTRSQGLVAVVWTFDPLVRRNAWFNLGKLGAQVVGYRECFYGTATDAINAGDETDRAFVWWPSDPAPSHALPKRGLVVLDDHLSERGFDNEPVLNVAIPPDIVVLRRTDPARARHWRRAVRATFGRAIDAGYTATAVTRDGVYTLERVSFLEENR